MIFGGLLCRDPEIKQQSGGLSRLRTQSSDGARSLRKVAPKQSSNGSSLCTGTITAIELLSYGGSCFLVPGPLDFVTILDHEFEFPAPLLRFAAAFRLDELDWRAEQGRRASNHHCDSARPGRISFLTQHLGLGRE